MNQSVLLVDDDENLLQGLLRTLHAEPYRVLTAKNGEHALKILAVESIDVIVSDDQMPGMGGLELLSTVNIQHPEIINIMLSGQATIGTVVRALNHGQIFRFLIKPCSAEELKSGIKQALLQKLLLDQCRVLLPMFKHQRAMLSEIERRMPGTIRSIEDHVSTIITKKTRDDAVTTEELSARMDVVIREADFDNSEML